jgi:carbonic anhydrase/acetyltransferase-like protein (isoleucine patch superfamily)
MKTLDQIEPSMPIGPLTTPGDATATAIISQPGAYHLTGEFQGEDGKIGILILASDVTLDLRGFTMRGLDAGALASGRAISSDLDAIDLQRRIAVRNGIIVGWPGGGVILDVASESRAEDLEIADVGDRGIVLGFPGADGDGMALRCGVRGVEGVGIRIDGAGLVRDCQVSNAAFGNGIDVGDGGRVINSSVRNAGFTGIDVGDDAVVFGCTVEDSGFVGISARSGAIIEQCSVTDSTDRGISGVSRTVIRDTTVTNTGQAGIFVFNEAILDGCVVSNAGAIGIDGFEHVRVAGCVVSGAGQDGINLGDNAQIVNTIVNDAGSDGIEVGANAVIAGCVIENAFLRGIQATTSATITDCTLEGAGLEGILTGIVANVQRCTVRSAGASGISVNESSSVIDCTINNAANDGVRVVSRSLVRGNTIDFCGSSAQLTGYSVNATGGQNRIDGNALTRADYCIRTGAGGNVIVNNSLSGWFTGATLLTGTNAAAPFLNSTTLNSTPHPQANILH